ncbi:MAG: hypothetical protein AB1589_09445, partial [Cyanobacteriota bacterium]
MVLTKTSDFIEIVLPAKRFGFGHVAVLSLVLPYLLVWGRPTWVVLNSSTLPFFLVLGSLSALGLGWIIYTSFTRTRIRIHRKQISFIKEWFGLRWQRSHPLPKGDSCQVELTQQYLTTNP